MTQNSQQIEKQRLLVFDLAGTLIDEGSEAPVRAFEEAFKKVGHPTTRETIVRYMGTNKREHIGYILTEMDHESWGKRFQGTATMTREQVYMDILERVYESFNVMMAEVIYDHIKPIDKVPEVIERLKTEKNFNVVITTGYNLPIRDIIVSESRKYWTLPGPIICGDSVTIGRPWPYLIFRAMEVHGTQRPSLVTKIGDTLVDIYAAQNAGVRGVGVCTGTLKMEDWKSHKIPAMTSVSNWFKEFPET